MQLIGVIVPDGFELSSFAPLSVFEAANALLGERHYVTRLLSENGGVVRGALGVEVQTQAFSENEYDTLLVGGTEAIEPPSELLTSFLRSAAKSARRIASIRLGAFALAEAGLLDDRRATTHWAFTADLAKRFPLVSVEADSIFVEDGPIWTSAGMTAGVDLAMGMLERDVGTTRTRDVARQLVVAQRRYGGNRQTSGESMVQPKSDRVQIALSHARSNLRSSLTVEELADAACLSPRQFTRVCGEETGFSPARAVEKLRLDAARLLISQGRLAFETIAVETGFGDPERMRRAFQRTCGLSPRALRVAAEPRVNI
jgi:transcriptional regulator GlxA family with amidase domain